MLRLRSIISFYKSYAAPSLAITIICMFFTYKYGIGTFAFLFWFKISTLGLFFYYIMNYKRNEFYYYKNLGLSKMLLWVSTLSFDFILYISMITLTLNIR